MFGGLKERIRLPTRRWGRSVEQKRSDLAESVPCPPQKPVSAIDAQDAPRRHPGLAYRIPEAKSFQQCSQHRRRKRVPRKHISKQNRHKCPAPRIALAPRTAAYALTAKNPLARGSQRHPIAEIMQVERSAAPANRTANLLYKKRCLSNALRFRTKINVVFMTPVLPEWVSGRQPLSTALNHAAQSLTS
jgi:hypothetical protein